ncbi:MAG: phosphate transport system regulatory protein PhoU [Dictyoglomus sp. NZ13-RE01]|nr:MAG: phosphate transport system regulatory protein PhoU [Dictyoglomus sp. NZ13-RE01]
MGKIVESMLCDSLEALTKKDRKLAEEVIERDDLVDKLNWDIEDRCLKLLALQQPMAQDLRVIAATMKIISDIERMGDYCVDIAKFTLDLIGYPTLIINPNLIKMFELVKKIINDSLLAFVNRDVDFIIEVVDEDKEIDSTYWKIFDEIVEEIESAPETAPQAIKLLMIARYLERIADHVTNVAERIYYMETGELKELHN